MALFFFTCNTCSLYLVTKSGGRCWHETHLNDGHPWQTILVAMATPQMRSILMISICSTSIAMINHFDQCDGRHNSGRCGQVTIIVVVAIKLTRPSRRWLSCNHRVLFMFFKFSLNFFLLFFYNYYNQTFWNSIFMTTLVTNVHTNVSHVFSYCHLSFSVVNSALWQSNLSRGQIGTLIIKYKKTFLNKKRSREAILNFEWK